MHRILEEVNMEIEEIERKGLNKNNLDLLYKLIDIRKDIDIIHAMEKDSKHYGENVYNYMYNKDEKHKEEKSYLMDSIHKVKESAEWYEHGKEYYETNGKADKMEMGLEKLMKHIHLLLEEVMECAESATEKQIIQKHMEKIKKM